VQTLANWNDLRPDAAARLTAVSPDPVIADRALGFLDTWLTAPIYQTQRAAILALITAGKFDLLLDSFHQLVPFGTGGRRGRVGFGPNRINQITVAMSVQGHCDYLRETATSSSSGTIVVAFDTRIFADIAGTYGFLGPDNPLLGLTSRALARIACEIYAGNGFEVYVPGLSSTTEYLATPELSFAIRHLGALGGINVSASHNHPDDNGFKFFNEQGAQDIPPTDQKMTSFMGDVTEIQRAEFTEAVADGRIRPLPEGLHAVYLGANLALRSSNPQSATIVYTPLCGTGNATVGDVLRAAGYDVQLYEPHANYDGTFAAVPLRLPNPEVPEAASPALGMARAVNADMVLCSDPDADRIGVFARDAAGRWRYLNGNEIASILAYYLVLDGERGPKRSGVLIKTLVTTRMIQNIAKQAGCPIVGDLLVGFKYIANVLLCLEREGRFEGVVASHRDLVMAGEESHGVLLTPLVRDKDAAGGALILCELVSQLRMEGRYLPEYLDALCMACGNYQNMARSMVMRGIRGAALLERMMRSLRDETPREFGGMPVLRFRDLLSPEHGPIRSDTDRLSRNFLVFELEQAQIVVRPSGTEPKAKIYVDVEGARIPGVSDRQGAAAFARRLAAQVLEECIGRIGYSLSANAHLLPDYLDLDLKADFDTRFRGDLQAALGKLSGQTEAHQIAWLRDRLKPYGGGSDPLGPTAATLEALFDDLGNAAASAAERETLGGLKHAVAAARMPVEWV
jgi:phosphoglucomutase/phosphomannomutase